MKASEAATLVCGVEEDGEVFARLEGEIPSALVGRMIERLDQAVIRMYTSLENVDPTFDATSESLLLSDDQVTPDYFAHRNAHG